MPDRKSKFKKKTTTHRMIRVVVTALKAGESIWIEKSKNEVVSVPEGNILLFQVRVHFNCLCQAFSIIAHSAIKAQTELIPVKRSASRMQATTSKGAAADSVRNVPLLYPAKRPYVWAAEPRVCNAAADCPMGPKNKNINAMLSVAAQSSIIEREEISVEEYGHKHSYSQRQG